jgi:C-terminal processing protease CtpA/Prc
MVGTDFLSKYHITFDYSKRKAYFQKPQDFSTRFSKNRAGIVFKKSYLDNQYIVHYVVPNSPAKKAGVKKGDALVSIYKEPASNFTMAEIERMMKQQSNMMEIHVRREDTIYRIHFRLSDF